MLPGYLLQPQQRGLSNRRHRSADAPLLCVLLVTLDLDGGAPVAQPGTDTDHERRRTPYSASFALMVSRSAVR